MTRARRWPKPIFPGVRPCGRLQPISAYMTLGLSCCSARVTTPNRAETAWGRQNIPTVGLQDLTLFLR